MNKILDKVTIICIDTYNIGSSVIALRKTLNEITPAACKFLTTENIELSGVEVIKIDPIKSKDDYSRFCIKELYKYFDTEFVLIIQHDGYVLNGNIFDERLYKYDYCGALWGETDGLNNGNGGFSWRSKKLCEIIANDDVIEILTPEDVSICRIYRRYLEGKYGLKWATDGIAEQFSFELREPICKTFGFHGYFHKPFKEVIVIRRMAAMGDVISVEPVLEYFYNKGYRVILDTLPQFQSLFYQHHYPIEFFDKFDKKRIPYKLIDLDMSYESRPNQLHLKTYYEYAGIKDGIIKNPSLNFFLNTKSDIKLFKKYCIIHIDKREQSHRNIYGINWESICLYLSELGYTIIQIGTDNHSNIKNAVKINTPNLEFLKWVIASSDLFLGIDSGPSHIASAFNIPSILFFGSVDPNIIHPNSSNKIYITYPNACDTPYCWHNSITTIGQKCIVDELIPPCTQYKQIQLINALNKIHGN